MWRMIKEIFTFEPASPATDIDNALDFLNKAVKRHAIVFLISDCMDEGFEKSIRLTARKHDLTVLRITDPAEETLPDVGFITLQDPETGEIATVNTGSARIRKQFEEDRKDRKEHLKRMLAGIGVDLVDISTSGDVVEPLLRLFDRRRKRLNA